LNLFKSDADIVEILIIRHLSKIVQDLEVLQKGHQECLQIDCFYISWHLISCYISFFIYENLWSTVSWSFSVPGRNWTHFRKNIKGPRYPVMSSWRRYPIRIFLVVQPMCRISNKKIACNLSTPVQSCGCWINIILTM
jgi:hypothetical protein